MLNSKDFIVKELPVRLLKSIFNLKPMQNKKTNFKLIISQKNSRFNIKTRNSLSGLP